MDGVGQGSSTRLMIGTMEPETKYTEDDLFRVLARPKFEEMVQIYRVWWHAVIEKDTTKRVAFMKKYGWTWFEFIHECKRQENSVHNL